MAGFIGGEWWWRGMASVVGHGCSFGDDGRGCDGGGLGLASWAQVRGKEKERERWARRKEEEMG